MSTIAKRCYDAVLLGNFGNNSHPIHPSTVHFPIAFLTLANVINLIYGAVLYLPSNPFMQRTESNLSTLSIAGYYLNVLGIITLIPAVLTGSAELVAMIKSNGLRTEEGNLVPKVKVTLLHAGLNDFVAVGAVYNWLRERHVPDFRPAGHQVVLSAGAIAISFYAAYLGGGLVYEHGVGVQRMGDGAAKKEKKQN